MSENQKKTLGIAIASLVCGCLFFVPVIGLLAAPAALILGIIALNKISKNSDTLKGKGLAIAGIVLGAFGILLFALFILVTVPRMKKMSDLAMVSVAKSDVESNLTTGLKLFELDNGRFPTQEEGLDALTKKVASVKNWNGPYVEREPVDPWGQEYRYQYPGIHNVREFDLYSVGKDGQADTDDDITNW